MFVIFVFFPLFWMIQNKYFNMLYLYAPFPFEEQGAYCYANVCRYVRPSLRLPEVDQLVSDHYLKKIISQSFRVSHADWS